MFIIPCGANPRLVLQSREMLTKKARERKPLHLRVPSISSLQLLSFALRLSPLETFQRKSRYRCKHTLSTCFFNISVSAWKYICATPLSAKFQFDAQQGIAQSTTTLLGRVVATVWHLQEILRQVWISCYRSSNTVGQTPPLLFSVFLCITLALCARREHQPWVIPDFTSQ